MVEALVRGGGGFQVFILLSFLIAIHNDGIDIYMLTWNFLKKNSAR